MEQSATSLAREVRDTIDRDLQAGKSALLALGTSPHLDTANYEEFHHQAQRVAETIPGSVIGLRNADGGLLAVTVVPWGTHVFPSPSTRCSRRPMNGQSPPAARS